MVVAIAVLPIVTALGYAALGWAPVLAVVVVFQFVRRASDFALVRPAREMLYTAVAREEKYKAKNFIDTAVYPGGDALSGWVLAGLTAAGFGLAATAWLSIPLAMVWLALSIALGRRHGVMSKQGRTSRLSSKLPDTKMDDAHRTTAVRWSRRDALKLALGLGAAMAIAPRGGAAAPATAQRPIPKSGETLPVIGLGTWQTFDVGGDAGERAAVQEVLRLFAQGGGRVVNSSPMYGSSEAVLGELASALGLQKSLFFATKVWTSGRDAGVRQMEASLQRMRVPRMDLMQVHNLVDVHTHLATLRDWKQAGKVRYLGITHYHSGAYTEVERLLRSEELDFLQINYSPVEREAEQRLLPLAAERGVAVLVNRPFASGALFGRVRGKPLPQWAIELGIGSWAQFFLAWILGQPPVTCAIPATRNPRHIVNNLGAGLVEPPDSTLRRRMLDELGI